VVSSASTLLDDMGSKNGTFHDGERLTSDAVTLRDGSRLAFGTVQITYREAGGGMPTLTHFVGG
jgi:pSer/pThr/pTyr-binding forkhead associated (FHA) protein